MIGIIAPVVSFLGGYFTSTEASISLPFLGTPLVEGLELNQRATLFSFGAMVVAYKLMSAIAGDREFGISYAPRISGLGAAILGHVYEEQFGAPPNTRYKVWLPSIHRVARTRYAGMDVYFTAHPKDISHLLLHSPDSCAKGPVYLFAQRVLGNGLATNIDDKIAGFHRREMAVAFSPASLKHIANLVVPIHAHRLKQIFSKAVREQNGRFKPRVHFIDLMMQINAEASFRLKDERRINQLIGWFTEAWDRNFNMARVDRNVDKGLLYQNFKIEQLMQKVKEEVAKIKKEIEEEGEAGPESTNSGDADSEARSDSKALIDYLVRTTKMTTEEISEHCITFLFAGYDTTACTISSLAWNLAKNPDVQEKLFEELSGTLGKGVTTTVEDLKSCTYLVNCIKESLRVKPPVLHLMRVVKDDMVLPGTKQFIPKGQNVSTCITVMQSSEELWGPDANEFKPERWEDPEIIEKVNDSKNGSIFAAFSMGRRNCIGKDFAMNSLIILCAAMIRNFKLVWPKDVQGDGPDFVMEPLMAPSKDWEVCVEERLE